MGFNLIYWTPKGGSYFLFGSNLGKFGKMLKNGRFSGRRWPDWGKYCIGGYGRIGVPPSRVFCLVYLTSLLFLIFPVEVSIEYCTIYARYNTILHDTTTYEDGFFMCS